jgi:hypothetical protein
MAIWIVDEASKECPLYVSQFEFVKKNTKRNIPLVTHPPHKVTSHPDMVCPLHCLHHLLFYQKILGIQAQVLDGFYRTSDHMLSLLQPFKN